MEPIKRQRQVRFEEIRQMDLPASRSRAILSVFQHRQGMQSRNPNPLEERLRQKVEFQNPQTARGFSENQRRMLNSVSSFLSARRQFLGIPNGQIPQNQQLSAAELLRIAERNKRTKQFRR